MTENRGLSALAAALELAPTRTPEIKWKTNMEYAAAILGERGVFLPDGLDPTDDYAEIIDRWVKIAENKERTIATLRAALDGLVATAEVTVGRFLDTPASLAGVHVAALNDLREALRAATKETRNG
jgi:hypothetical protein